MDKRSVSTSMSPEVNIGEVQGDLQIKSWDQSEVVVNAETDDLDLQGTADSVTINCQGDCLVRVPQGAKVQVGSIHGDGHAKNLEGDLNIGEVNGSLVLRNVAATQVGAVHGELSVREVDGELRVSQVNGQADVREVHGGCWLQEVNGHMDLRNIEGDLQASAGGNARIRLDSMTGNDYRLTSGGNMHCAIPDDANLKLKLSSSAELIKVRLPEISKAYRQGQVELQTGSGEAAMEISAGGALYLFCQEAEWMGGEERDEEGLGEMTEEYSRKIASEVEAQIAAQMDAINRQIDEQMSRISESIGSVGFSPEQTQRIIEQARQASERGTERAQEKIRRAQEKLERKLEHAQHRREIKAQINVGRGRHSWGFEIPRPPASPTPPVAPVAPARPPVSEEERLLILKMLEQKKISLEEADNLLSALEGKE